MEKETQQHLKKKKSHFFQRSEMDLCRMGFLAEARPTSFHAHNPWSLGSPRSSRTARAGRTWVSADAGCGDVPAVRAFPGIRRNSMILCWQVKAQAGHHPPALAVTHLVATVTMAGHCHIHTGGCTKAGGKGAGFGGRLTDRASNYCGTHDN